MKIVTRNGRTDGIESGRGTQCFISIVFCRKAAYKSSSVV